MLSAVHSDKLRARGMSCLQRLAGEKFAEGIVPWGMFEREYVRGKYPAPHYS